MNAPATLQPVRLVVLPHPLRSERVIEDVPPGMTVAQLVEVAKLHHAAEAHVLVGDVVIPRAWWGRVRPKPGASVLVRALPAGGGGKGPLGLLLSVATFFVPVVGPTVAIFGKSIALGTLLIKGGLFLAGALLSGAFAGPPKPKKLDSSTAGPVFGITGVRNQVAPYGPVPRVYGRRRVFPLYAALPFTEIVGGEQYLRAVFCFGHGPLQLSDMRIGDTPLAEFQDVEVEVRPGYQDDPPLGLYWNRNFQDSVNIVLRKRDGHHVRRTRADVDRATIETAMPSLIQFDQETGDQLAASVTFEISYRKVGEAAWNSAGITGTSTGTSTSLLYSTTATGNYFRQISLGNVPSGPVAMILGGFDSVAELESVSYVVSYREAGATTWTAIGATAQEVTTGFPSFGVYSYSGFQQGIGFQLAVPTGKALELRIDFQGANAAAYGVPVVQAVSYPYSNGTITIRARRQALSYRQYTISFPERGQYDVRMARITADNDETTLIQDDITWTSLRSIQFGNPVLLKGLCLVAMRIRASEQLNGVIEQFSAVAQAMLPTWDGSAWTDPVPTRSPAWAYADLLTGTCVPNAIDRARLDTTTLLAWANECAAAGRNFDAVFDAGGTMFENATDVAAVGRASFTKIDGLYTVVRDLPDQQPVQLFTPRNSWGYNAQREYRPIVHSVKVLFDNQARDWAPDERIVYNDGYGPSNATEEQSLELFGVTDPAQAWVAGRYHLANYQLRPEVHTFFCSVESVRITRGDVIAFQHDVPLIGLASGRIKSVLADGGGNVLAITVDEPLAMAGDGTEYAIRLQLASGAVVLAGVDDPVPGGGEYATVALTEAIPAADAPAAGDLFAFGEATRETITLLVQQIEPRTDQTALITCVEYAPAVFTADTQAIPPWQSNITQPVGTAHLRPQAPQIQDVVSDERAMVRLPDGSLLARIVMAFSVPVGSAGMPQFVQAQIAADGGDPIWQTLPLLPGDANGVIFDDVVQGEAYRLRLRAIMADGRASERAEITHTVVGATAVPPDIEAMTLIGGVLQWDYDPPVDLAGYRVRYQAGTASSWANATPAHQGLLVDQALDVSAFGNGGTITWLAKAVDAMGNESDGAALVVQQLGDVLTDNVVVTTDVHAGGFTGEITGGAVNGGTGDLEASVDVSAPFWGADLDPFWGADSDPFWVGTFYRAMTYLHAYRPVADHIPAGKLVLDLAVTAVSYTVEYRTVPAVPFWGADLDPFWGADLDPFWAAGEASAWRPWPGEVSPLADQDYQIRITTAAGPVQGAITGLQILVDMPDKGEILRDVAIGASGTRLPITQSYLQITGVQLTLVEDGGSADNAIVADYDTTTGPLVKTRQGGTGVTGTVNARIQGY